ncbi:solute carrier organic anion transporter family member 74D-like [Drosophila tropicalis]|uniref:solute carrier organic anion transporter family member 74D-like n=1 Tax=Drosophila tropicalis TaxID=46794 RepID=UPI0035ABC2B0
MGEQPIVKAKEAEEPFLHHKEGPENQIDEPDEDTTCGFWIFKGKFLQRFATERMYVTLYGIAGCALSMTFAYFNGTITTLEKRYKIPTRMSGIISVGNDMTTMFASALLGYYAGSGHRCRWMGVGLLTFVIFCLLTSSLHFLYGSGEEALKLTREFGAANGSEHIMHLENNRAKLCQQNASSLCVEESEAWIPQAVLLTAQLISGVGQALFYVLGISYMDDNLTKAKSAVMLSVSTFLKMLGPAIGFSLAAFCLRLYIEPSLEPLITPKDPRWLGAWWLGWLILAAAVLACAIFMFFFPKELPSAKARRMLEKLETKHLQPKDLSVGDMMTAIRRILGNKVFILNTFSSIVYFFGYMVYWIFTPKYIEVQYRQSAAVATMATGTVALGFSAAGVLLSGYVLSKYKPSARFLAAWNATVDFLTVAGMVGYVFIACEGSDNVTNMTISRQANDTCSPSCHCDYVAYAPICGPQNVTYISPCHAGCMDTGKDDLGQTIFTNCQCMGNSSIFFGNSSLSSELPFGVDGPCPVDCFGQFITFLVVMCILKLFGASSKNTGILISLRSVLPEDKSFALGLGSMVACIFAFIPSPIFFGWLIDNYCLVWGKTCSNKGNCWLYDTKSMRYAMNLTAAFCVFLGGLLNIAVWYYAKDLKIFDAEDEKKPKNHNLDKIKLSSLRASSKDLQF